MREKISTLANPPVLTYRRADGNSTRLVDHAIQLLFQGYTVEVRDHWENGNHHRANQFLFDAIAKRIHSEHQNIVEFVKFDKKKLEISLTK